MSDLLPTSTVALPLPRVDITIRPGVMSDVPFLDSLQKLHTKQVGWMPTAQFEGKIKLGHVLIAEEESGSGFRVSGCGSEHANTIPSSRTPEPGPRNPIGYLIGNDQYFKRDDVGIIYQMNVLPGKQRGLIGASLLKAQFERSAYGCKLYCCWCAQDIAANKYWEAMGFVPLAFRAGSEKKSRVHIFWQKRIRQGDTTTPWWFPSQTSGGSIREDRLVLPIPPGTHWSDAKPLILPGMERASRDEPKKLPSPQKHHEVKERSAITNRQSATSLGGLRFAPPMPPKTEKPVRQKTAKVKQKNDAKLIAAARELRDRWLEQLNTNPLLPQGKYDVSRVEAKAHGPLPGPQATQIPMLLDGTSVAA